MSPSDPPQVPRADVLYVTHCRAAYTRKSLPGLLKAVEGRGRVWIWHNGKQEYLGYFYEEEAAVKAYAARTGRRTTLVSGSHSPAIVRRTNQRRNIYTSLLKFSSA